METAPAPPPPADAPAPTKDAAPADANLLAGRFKTPEALGQGINELRVKQGLDAIDGQLFGSDGRYANLPAAEAAYGDLVKQMSRANQTAPAPKPPAKPGEPMKIAEGAPPPKPGAPDRIDGMAVLQASGLENDAVVRQFQEHGSLTEGMYDAIRDGFKQVYGVEGLPNQLIQDYIGQQQQMAQMQQTMGQQAQQQIRDSAAQLVGGEQTLNTILTSARDFVPADEIDDLNTRLKNPKTYKGAVRQLHQMYQQHVGADGSAPLVDSGQSPPPGAVGFRAGMDTLAEYNAAIRKAAAGDAAAAARVNATTLEDLQQLR